MMEFNLPDLGEGINRWTNSSCVHVVPGQSIARR